MLVVIVKDFFETLSNTQNEDLIFLKNYRNIGDS